MKKVSCQYPLLANARYQDAFDLAGLEQVIGETFTKSKNTTHISAVAKFRGSGGDAWAFAEGYLIVLP